MSIKIKSIIFLLFILPYSLSSVGGACSNGKDGVCITVPECNNYGGKVTLGNCPYDGNDIKCCSEIPCLNRKGACTWNCAGNSHPGNCPGGNGFICCT